MGITSTSFIDAADKVADKEHRKGVWEVWAKYAIRRDNKGQRYVLAVKLDESELPPRVDLEKALEKTSGVVAEDSHEEKLIQQAVERREQRDEGWRYCPLVEEPELFLKFARLADDSGLDNDATAGGLNSEKNAEVALDWAETYGTLGLTPGVEIDGFRGASTRGGKADTVSAFAKEAWQANTCLRLYEAATAKELDVDLIASYMYPRYKTLFTRTPARVREWALNIVATQTQRKIAGDAYPALYGEVGRFVAGWSFTSLLGAMWLQMFWLLTTTEAPRRCRNPECDKIIAFKQPDQPTEGTKPNDRSGGYRTRKDKKFCDKTCRDRAHYLLKTKPARQAARRL